MNIRISCKKGVDYIFTVMRLPYLSRTVQKWLFRNLGGRKWMKLSGEQGSKLFSVMGNAMHSLKTLFRIKPTLTQDVIGLDIVQQLSNFAKRIRG